jgi:hypothetical protein
MLIPRPLTHGVGDENYQDGGKNGLNTRIPRGVFATFGWGAIRGI